MPLDKKGSYESTTVSQSVSQSKPLVLKDRILKKIIKNRIFMKCHTNFSFLKAKKVIKPGKLVILEGKPEISLKVQLFGVGKKFVPLMEGFPNSVRGEGEVNSPQ